MASEWLALLHFEGADDSTTFTDEVGRAWASNGAAKIKTAASKFGSSSFLGTADKNGAIAATPHASYLPQGVPTTVDCWIKSTSATQYSCLWDSNAGGNGSTLLMNPVANDGKIALYTTNGPSPLTTATGGYNDGDWHHVAVVYNPFSADANYYWRIFVDGFLEANNNDRDGYSGATSMEIGGSTFFNRGFVGYIDEFAWRNGAIWTSDFTPPTAAYSMTPAPSGADIRTVPLMPRRVP